MKDLQSVDDLSGETTGYDKGLFSVVFHYKNRCLVGGILSCNVVNLDMGNHENVSQNDWSRRKILVLGIDSSSEGLTTNSKSSAEINVRLAISQQVMRQLAEEWKSAK